ncbi:aspartyl/asparaginyl beta-hydroxylase domain-containing protein [Nonomuraea sp. NPDC047529]|uniref:aspartyl/asparaginyl beta-hydroxylase domain-containing protein n=1 Tax=Nonomuraea sp. NPDC047529 TaxID=3155623 RepID=UPI0033CEA608
MHSRSHDLDRQVTCTTATIDGEVLERVRHEVLTVPSGWVTEYGQYQSGGWDTLSLLNATGQATDVTIADCQPITTDLLAAMPETGRLLNALQLTFMWARIARLAPNSYLWEHRDYGELVATERHRLHIPIVTSSSAILILAGRAVHLEPGKIWQLTPTFPHGAANLHGPHRIHLILDCYADSSLTRLTDGAHLPASAVRDLPPLTDGAADESLSKARALLQLGYTEAAERLLLHLYFTHQLGEGVVYDMLTDLHESVQETRAATVWQQRKSVLLGLHERSS